MEKEEKLYPVYFEGKAWTEEECDDVFVAFYHTRAALGISSSVYLSGGDRVCPDGSWIYKSDNY